MLPALILWLTSAPATRAQVASSPTSWAVIDFANRSAYGGNEVGREASDSLVVELGKSNRYAISARQDIQKAVDTLGLTPPLDTIAIQKLGREMGVAGIVTGDVVGVSFTNSPRVATVVLATKVIDPISGEIVNGALSKGVSTPRAIPTTDDDALVNQAIDNATFNAVRQMNGSRLPQGTVIGNQENIILINKGTRDGYYNGLNMFVTRLGQEVGKIRITNATADSSNAVSTEQILGARPQDRVNAIYELPKYSVTPSGQVITAADTSGISSNPSSHSSSNGAFNGVFGVVLAVVVAALLLNLAHRGSGSGALAGGNIGHPRALFGRVSDPVSGGLGVGGVAPAGVTLATYVPVAVKITADTGNIPFNDFLEYHVYRQDFANVDLSVNGVFTVLQAPILTEPTQGPLMTYDDGADKSISFHYVSSITGGLIEADSKGLPVSGTGIPLSLVGQRFQYFIEGVWTGAGLNQPTVPGSTGSTGVGGTSGFGGTNGGNTSAGAATGGTTGGGTSTTTGTIVVQAFYTTGRSPTNFVTYIEPPLVSQNSFNGTGPSNVNFSIPSTRGANDYALQISADPLFHTGVKTFGPTNAPIPGSASQTDPRQGNTLIFFTNKDLRIDFPGQTSLYARVGARDTSNGGDQGSNPYIFSDPIQVPTFLL